MCNIVIVTEMLFGNLQVYVFSERVFNWGERERAPSCGLDGRAVTIYRRTFVRAYVHRYCACAALRANVAGQIGNRFSPAESAFSACIGSGSSQTS